MTPYTVSRVALIVDPSFGERLLALATDVPAWVVESAMNTPVVHDRWQAEDDDTSEAPSNVTLFSSQGLERDEVLIRILETVEDHHDDGVGGPGFAELEVHGVGLDNRIEEALRAYGFERFRIEADGFIALRR